MRPNRVTLTPKASDVDGVSTDTLVQDEYKTINGALATGFDADGLVTTVNPSSGGTITMDGAALNGSQASLTAPQCVVVVCSGDETARTFTISGIYDGESVSEAITGVNADTAVGSQRFDTITSVSVDDATAGNITVGLNGYMDFTTPQKISITSNGDDSGATLTVLGTDRYGNDISEDITEPDNTTVTGSTNFRTVYAISSDANAVGTVTIGVDGTCDSQWFPLNVNASTFNVALLGDITGTAEWGVQLTYDDPFDKDFDEHTAYTIAHNDLSGESADGDGSQTTPCTAVRFQITSHTSGSLNCTVIESTSGH